MSAARKCGGLARGQGRPTGGGPGISGDCSRFTTSEGWSGALRERAGRTSLSCLPQTPRASLACFPETANDPPPTDQILASFRETVGGRIDLNPEGVDRYVVSTPFVHDDGDRLEIVLRRDGGRWVLADEGCILMSVTFDTHEAAVHKGTRQRIIANTLGLFGVDDRDGQLVLPVPDDRFGDALFTFVQAILRIGHVLSREQLQSAFRKDLRAFVADSVAGDRLTFDWRDDELDPKGMYSADCRVEYARTTLFVFGPATDGATRDATVALLQYEQWGRPFRSLVIFEDLTRIGRRVLARLTNVCDRQYSSLGGNRERIRRFLAEGDDG